MNPQQQERLDSLLDSTSFLGIGLVIAILIMAAGFHLVRSWYRDSDDPADSADEILDQMRELHSEGDLSEEEFRSIKSRLSSQSKE